MTNRIHRHVTRAKAGQTMPRDLDAGPPVRPSTLNILRDRCRQLGLFCWQCDATGSLINGPDSHPSVERWLGCSDLRTQIEQQARTWLDGRDPRPHQLSAGCWVIPIKHDAPALPEGITVVMALGQEILDHEQLEIVGRATATEPAALAQTLTPLACHTPQTVNNLAQMLAWSRDDIVQATLSQRAIDEFSEKLIQAYEETNLLFRMARYLNRIASPTQIMDAICAQAYEIMPFRWIAVQFNESPSVVKGLSGTLVMAGRLPCDQEAFQVASCQIVTGVALDNWTCLLDPAKNELAAMVGSEVVIDPIAHDNTVIGCLLAGNKGGPDPEVSSVETQFLDALADFLSVFHENIARFQEQKDMFLGTLGALTASIDAKDRYTRGHSERVAFLAAQLALAMGMNHEQAERARIAGLVHDVGKIGVPEAVLCKQGRLTADEFVQIKRHPGIGYEILKDIPPMQDVLPGVLYHHERWDGTGYPEGLSGSDIPLFGRILALADTYDAMSSNRSYRPAIPRDKVLQEMRQCAGSQFDPELAQLFVGLDMSGYVRLVDEHRAASETAA